MEGIERCKGWHRNKIKVTPLKGDALALRKRHCIQRKSVYAHPPNRLKLDFMLMHACEGEQGRGSAGVEKELPRGNACRSETL